MYHYAIILSHLGAREKVVHLWRDHIPQQAIRHPFLMHGLLAYAALHLAYLRPDNAHKYLQLSDKHQAIAVQKYRSMLCLPSVDPEVADALFALSATLSFSPMARSCALTETTTMDMDTVTEMFILTRGIVNVINLTREHIKQSPMMEMLRTRDYIGVVHLPLCVSSQFDAIRHMLASYGLDQDALEHCQYALQKLEEVYKNISYFSPTHNMEIGDITRWQVIVSMGYVRLIQARIPPALVILAHYAAAITSVRTAWYTQNWAEYALRGISAALDSSMQHWIEWPVQQARERMSVLGVRSPDEASRSLD